MELFEHGTKAAVAKDSPLAARMRPRTLDEYIGQGHILAEGRLLRRAINADQISSLIFYGPPGTGKTTLASVIANTTSSRFEILNAVLTGVKEIRDVIAAAQNARNLYQRRTILFVDEVHRWNKSQQDALLPWVENGTVILIGATTENPFFSVNKALLSRSRVFQLKALTEEEIAKVLQQAIICERGLLSFNVKLESEAQAHLIKVANGDARAALNALELAVLTTEPNFEGKRIITLEVAEESIQQQAVLYDQEGDYHFDTISAFIKSIRGSDVDATLYWMAKMVYAGEDPRYIFRRMIISSVEDIGLANPQAMQYVQSAADAFDRIGMPEGNFLLANAAIFLATSPKSNSALAFFDALKVVREQRDAEVPNHLRDAARDKEGFGHGAGYQYPHAYRDHWVAQQYLPDSLQGRIFYNPGRLGYEKSISDDVNRRREEQLAAMLTGEIIDAPVEILTFSPADKEFDRWIQRTINRTGNYLRTIREHLFSPIKMQRHFRVLVINDESGLLTWEALRVAPEGGVWSLLKNKKILDLINSQCLAFHEDDSIQLRLPQLALYQENEFAKSVDPKIQFEVMILRNYFQQFCHVGDAIDKLLELCVENTQISLAETLPATASRISSFVNWPNEELKQRIQNAEEQIYTKYRYDLPTLQHELQNNDRIEFLFESRVLERPLQINATMLQRWFDSSNDQSYLQILKKNISEEDAILLKNIFHRQLLDSTVMMKTTTLFALAKLKK